MATKNKNFFTGLEDDEIFEDQTDLVDQNVDEDGEIEAVISETDVPEDGVPASVDNSDVVSVEDFNHFFNPGMGFEDDEEIVTDETDEEVVEDEADDDEAPVVNVSVDIETGDADENVEDTDDVAGEESYDIFGFEDEEDPIDQAADVSDDEASDDEAPAEEGDDEPEESDDEPEESDDNDIGVDINVNVNVDDGSDDSEEPAPESEEISQEDFDFGFYGLEDDEPEVNVEVTVDGETEEVTTTDDEPEEESDDPVDQAAAADGEIEDNDEPAEEEVGEEDDDEEMDTQDFDIFG